MEHKHIKEFRKVIRIVKENFVVSVDRQVDGQRKIQDILLRSDLTKSGKHYKICSLVIYEQRKLFRQLEYVGELIGEASRFPDASSYKGYGEVFDDLTVAASRVSSSASSFAEAGRRHFSHMELLLEHY